MASSSSRRLVPLALLGLGTQVHSAEPTLGPAAVERLKQTYLACDREATVSRLQSVDAVACSAVAEQLLRRGFDGDFERLLAWWHTARLRADPVRSELSRR